MANSSSYIIFLFISFAICTSCLNSAAWIAMSMRLACFGVLTTLITFFLILCFAYSFLSLYTVVLVVGYL